MKTDSLIDQKENKHAYVKKMKRQIAEGDARIRDVERIVSQRDAGKNPQIKKDLDKARVKLDAVTRAFEVLLPEQSVEWPDASRNVSALYRDLERVLEDISAKVRRN